MTEHTAKLQLMSANQRAGLTCHALTLFVHTEALQLLLLVGEVFSAHAACQREHVTHRTVKLQTHVIKTTNPNSSALTFVLRLVDAK